MYNMLQYYVNSVKLFDFIRDSHIYSTFIELQLCTRTFGRRNIKKQGLVQSIKLSLITKVCVKMLSMVGYAYNSQGIEQKNSWSSLAIQSSLISKPQANERPCPKKVVFLRTTLEEVILQALYPHAHTCTHACTYINSTSTCTDTNSHTYGCTLTCTNIHRTSTCTDI